MRRKKSNQQHINLLVTIDRNYLFPLTKMLQSYSLVHKEVITDLYIAHSALEKKDINMLEKEVNDNNIHIHSIRIANNWFDDTPVLERLPKESFYRLMAFDYLPKDIDICLYLDPDIYIRKSLLSLYNMDLGNHYIAGASHLYGMLNFINKLRLDLDNQERYINSGILVMNLKQIRKDFTTDKIFESLESNIQKLFMGDQDLINILFGNNMILLDEKIYNLDEKTFKHNVKKFPMEQVEKETAIIHYNGKYKPWLYGYKGVLNKFYPEIKEKGTAPVGKLKGKIKSILNIDILTIQQKIALLAFVFFIGLCIILYFFFGKKFIEVCPDSIMFREWLEKFGPFDELMFIIIRAIQTVIKFMPGEPFEIASGYAWGPILGMLYCLIGNLIGTIIIFILTRKYGKKVMEFLLPIKNISLFSLLSSSNKIYALLFFLYLIPGSPKDGLTYFAALLPIKFFPFVIITGIARIPSVLSSTLCGATLANNQYMLSIGILVLIIIFSIIGIIIYRKITKKRVERA